MGMSWLCARAGGARKEEGEQDKITTALPGPSGRAEDGGEDAERFAGTPVSEENFESTPSRLG